MKDFQGRHGILFILAVVAGFVGVFAGVAGKPQNACAAPVIAPTPCDPLYYQSLEARALLEADREVTQNQNLIYKPDSVLSYTCFDKFYLELADHADEMFSESTRWGSGVLGGNQATHMNIALQDLVEAALIAYLNGNFHGSNTTYLGGRATSAGARSTPSGSVPNGGSYSCDVMARVWMDAKCYNFQGRPEDGFYTFSNYASSADRRTLPSPCSATPNFTGNLVTALTGPPWVPDVTQTYLQNFNVTNCGAGGYPPIPTGLNVVRAVISPTNYPEFVCIQPGCHYDPAANTCVP